MRPLTLHASALNNEEYDFYTTSLKELNDDRDPGQSSDDDAYYEAMQIGVREARAWMRGRYAHLQPSTIDSILRFFTPGLAATDVLSGGQFFAALRLVVHADQGKDIDRSLGFVQAAHPAPPKVAPSIVSPHSTHNPFVSRVPPLPPRKPAPPPKHVSASHPMLPPSRKSTSPIRPALPAPHVHPPPPPPPPHHPPVHPKPSHVTSTLMKQSLQASKAAQTMKRAEAQLEKERVLQVLKSSAVVPGGYSLAGARVERSSIVVGTSVRTTHHNYQGNGPIQRGGETSPSISSSDSGEGRAPPLPRRRDTRQQQPSPPVSISSMEQVALARAPSEPSPSPPSNSQHSGAPITTSIRPPPSHLTSNTFPSVPNTQSTTNADSNNPYRRPSTSSYKSYTASPQGSPSRVTADLPPPTHPDRLPPPVSPSHPTSSPFGTPAMNDTEGSPTTRVFRSKSLHHPSPPPLPPLPAAPPRRRPESIQVLADRDGTIAQSLSRHPSFSTIGRVPHRRQASLSASFSSLGLDRDKDWQEKDHDETNESPLGKFARSWQPRLEKARYKAEAGLSRRGYVRERSRSKGPEETEDLLVPSSPFGNGEVAKIVGRWQGHGYGYDYDPPSVDGSVDMGNDASPSPHRDIERDEMKWPVREGEGWRPL
ncbi:hypothetical protein H0H87_012956 [Tephrocybe sp. NHM501043]|nr:hypothetical protein H0H87_012956 [Tephrocybe sp. NHM501043]